MRRFELVDGSADKFWSIGVDGATVRVHYGRNGTNGQVKEKTYADAAAAAADVEKQVAAKEKKGYAEGAGTTAPAGVPAPRPAPAPTPATAPAPTAVVVAEPEPPAAPSEPGESAEPGEPGDLGVVLSEIERAAFPENPPLASTAVPATDEDPGAIADRWEAWAAEHVARQDVSGYRREEYYALTPFDQMPDVASARWWRAFTRDIVPQVREPESQDFRDATFAEWRDFEALGLVRRDYQGLLTVRERARRAREVATDPAAVLPPPMHDFDRPGRNTRTTSTAELAIDLALEGREAVLAHAVWRPAFDWVPGLRALLPDLGADELDAALAATEHSQRTDVERAPLLFRSALLGDAESHDRMLADLDPLYLDSWDKRIAAALPLPDADARSAFLDGVLDAFRAHALAEGDDPDEVSEWSALPDLFGLAVFGQPVLDRAVRVIQRKGNTTMATVATQRLAERVTGPGAVGAFLRLAAASRAGAEARSWLLAHPASVAAYDGRPGSAEAGVLDAVVREILAGDPSFSPRSARVIAVVTAIREEAELPVLGADGPPDWWTDAVTAEETAPVPESKLKVPRKLPAWTTSLPVLRVDGARLDADRTREVLLSAARSGLDPTLAPRPLVAAVRDRMTTGDRDRFASALLAGWLGNGGASGERTLFLAAGFLGAEGLVAELAPQVRAWPGQSQHQRAVLGLDVLAATATTSAMQAISGIANKSKFKGVQKAANESLQRLADLQGLTVDEFQDRVVPDGGLDPRGVRVLDYGPRRFRVALGADGKPVVHALGDDDRPTGKPRTALPAANGKDDAELAAEAKKEFTLLRKQLTEVAKIQTSRLERAMVTGRVWSAADHEAYVARHPVLNSLVRPLVWRLVEADGTATLVRVTDEREYVTVDEDPVEPGAGATLTLAHPLTLTDAEKGAWRAHLLDYELTSPVEQLDRAVYPLPEGQSGYALGGLPTGEIGPGALTSTLERDGWHRGQPQDAGVVHAFSLALPAYDVGVVLEISEGLWSGMLHESGPQRIDAVSLVPLSYVERGVGYVWWDREDVRIAWTSAHPVVVSEVRRSLAAVAARMETTA